MGLAPPNVPSGQRKQQLFYHVVASADLMCTPVGCLNLVRRSMELVTALDVQGISSSAVPNSPELYSSGELGTCAPS